VLTESRHIHQLVLMRELRLQLHWRTATTAGTKPAALPAAPSHFSTCAASASVRATSATAATAATTATTPNSTARAAIAIPSAAIPTNGLRGGQ